MFKVDIYIKIRFHGNPKGPGNAAAIAEYIQKGIPKTKMAMSKMPDTTENRLALSICNDALNLLKRPCSITIHINNGYVRHTAANGWVERWSGNNWKRHNGNPPANLKEWQQFMALSKGHVITWEPCGTKYGSELDKILKGMEGTDEMQ